MKRLLKRAITCAMAVTLMLPPLAEAAFNKMYVFGDSLSDSGNAYNIVLNDSGEVYPPPPNNQRNSNGLVAVEYLAQNLGVPISPSYTGGSNYAVSGAMTGVRTVGSVTTENYAPVAYGNAFGTTALQFGTSLLSQVGNFSLDAPNVEPSSTLFVVWAGANDFFFDPQGATIFSAIENISKAISTLAFAGARTFLLPGLPDLSLTPVIMELDAANPGAGIAAGYHALSLGFNDALENVMTPLLESTIAGLDITYFDVDAALHRILGNTAEYGLTNVNEGCVLFGVSTCANPDEYLFWDQVHPTDKIARVLAEQFAVAVPEPETYTIVALGLIALAVARRRKKASLD